MKNSTDAKKDHNNQQDNPIGLSLLVGIFGFFLLSLIIESLETSIFGVGNSDIHFLMIGTEKFLLVLWIIATVLFIERNDLKSLGLAREDARLILTHSLGLFLIITTTFFVIFIPGLILSGDIGPGFATTKVLITLPTFWFFILASAISEEIFFRAFLIMRFAWIAETKAVSLLGISLIYGILHYSLWGSVGAFSFGVWGFIIGFYYVYVRENVVITSIAHLISDITIFTVGALILGMG